MKHTFRFRGRMSGFLIGVVAVATVLTGSGVVAYASGSGGSGGCDGLNGNGCGGIIWTSYSTPVPSASNVKCSISISTATNTLVEAVSNLAPGQSCGFAAQLKNTEKDAVTITEKGTITEPAKCKLFGYVDNVLSSPPPVIPSGHYFSYHGTVSLSASAGNVCEGTHASFYIVISATPYVKCSE